MVLMSRVANTMFFGHKEIGTRRSQAPGCGTIERKLSDIFFN